jgi:hypothetical protein
VVENVWALASAEHAAVISTAPVLVIGASET